MAAEEKRERRQEAALPPTPPDSEQSGEEKSDCSPSTESSVDYPLPPSTTIPTEILDADKKTPDEWLARDPRLIRLTGVHPFNVEAPLSDLFNEGFLTSPELFYVRNRGPVPRVDDANIPSWEFSVEFSKIWIGRKGVLHLKKSVSCDTRIFRFKLDHGEQTLGLPVGQHLMIRMRDPATRETIIRSYTPISETDEAGFMGILVKIYFDTKQRNGGKMSQALNSISVGHSVDFKGPLGKFEYHGQGSCTVNDTERIVDKFIMISGGTGITPIYQVLRAVMQDESDETQCVILDGNRLFEDILCKHDLDSFAQGNAGKCQLLYTLTQAPDDWEGLRGRIAAPLLKEHCSRTAHQGGKTLILICGPEGLEKSVHEALLDDGWTNDDMVFF